MYARNGAHSEQQVNQFVGTVSHKNTFRPDPITTCQSLHQFRIPPLRITMSLADCRFHGLTGGWRHPQRIFIARKFDYLIKPITEAYLLHAQSRLICLEFRHLGPNVRTGRERRHCLPQLHTFCHAATPETLSASRNGRSPPGTRPISHVSVRPTWVLPQAYRRWAEWSAPGGWNS